MKKEELVYHHCLLFARCGSGLQLSFFPKQPNQNRSTFKLQNSLTNGTVEGSSSKYTLDYETKIYKKSLPTVSGHHVGSLVALPDF